MIAIAIVSWFFYAVALALKAYANRVRFMARHEMPLAFSRSAGFGSKFWLSRLAITYGSLVGLWLAHGIPVQVAAFVFYLLFSAYTFFRGSRRSIKKWAQVDFERRKHDAKESGVDFEEDVAWFNASKWGEEIVEENVGKNGNL
jgi:uncharacterized membrane protein YfcA